MTPWLPEANDQNRVVIRASGAAAGQFARGGYEAVFDGVLGPWWLPTFFEASELDELHSLGDARGRSAQSRRSGPPAATLVRA